MCRNENKKAWEQLIFLKTEDGKIIIQSRWNGRNLQIQKNGQCVFAKNKHNPQITKICHLLEKFEVECDEAGNVYFVSCHALNVMQCNEHGIVKCVNKNRSERKQWKIVYPPKTQIMTSRHLRRLFLVCGLTCLGTVTLPLLGCCAGACVPGAMSTFGTVVPGVGTFHAPLAAVGVAASLQAASVALISVRAAAVGAAMGSKVNEFL